MGIIRKLILVVLVAVMVLLIGWSEQLTMYSISNLNFSWLSGLLLPKVLLLLSIFGFLLCSLSSLKTLGGLKWVAGLFIFGLPIGSYLIVNIPYANEWVKHGTELESEELNPIETFLQEQQPDFDGLICFSLPGCPHCEIAIGKLAVLQQRQPELDLVVFVFTEDSTVLDSYKNQPIGSSLAYLAVPNPNESLKLNRGKFPSFFYLKNGKLIHRWFSSEFGYPAFDWAENRLQ